MLPDKSTDRWLRWPLLRPEITRTNPGLRGRIRRLIKERQDLSKQIHLDPAGRFIDGTTSRHHLQHHLHAPQGVSSTATTMA
jgi:hypothetical protein